MSRQRLAIVLTAGLLGLLIVALGVLTGPARADQRPPALAPAAILTVCPAGPPDCQYSQLQAAVDAAGDGDVIKVAAGLYTGVNNYGGLSQLVYLTRTLTIRGGYTAPDFSEPPDPMLHPTVLDAQALGRVVFITGTVAPVLEGLVMQNGSALGLGGGTSGADAGGGLYAANATLHISGSSVLDSEARLGGGLYVGNGQAVVTNSAFEDNDGSGLFLYHTDATVTGTVIRGNNARYSGGGLTASVGDFIIRGNLFEANWVYDSFMAPVGGAALYLSSVQRALVEGNTIRQNYGAQCGGAINAYGGTGITIRDNTIVDNEAFDTSGGAFFFQTGALTVTGNLIAGSESHPTGEGAGLYVELAARAVISGNVIVNNEGYSGVYLSHAAFDLNNNVIAATYGDTYRSGLSVLNQSQGAGSHNTIADNGNRGVTVYSNSELELTDTIVASHQTGLASYDGSSLAADTTLWWNNDVLTSGLGIVTENNLHGDPAFVDPAGHDYHIGPASAARDSGVDAGLRVDFEGQPRPIGAGYDIGADEMAPPLAAFKRGTPNPVLAGGVLSWSLWVTNTGFVTATVAITDLLPPHVSPGGIVTWTPVALAPGDAWTATLAVTVEEGYGGPLTNVLRATAPDGTAVYTDVVQATRLFFVYLPIVRKE